MWTTTTAAHKLFAHLSYLEEMVYRNNLAATMYYTGRARETILAAKRGEVQGVARQLLTTEMLQNINNPIPLRLHQQNYEIRT